MATRLTKKQKGFVKDVVATDNATFAIINNYDIKSENKKDVAKSMGSENLAKPYIAEAVEQEKKRIADGIPDDLLLRVHLEGLEAAKEVWKNNNESGEMEKVSEEPDYATRHKYLDSGYKLKGSYAAEKSIVAHIPLVVKILHGKDDGHSRGISETP